MNRSVFSFLIAGTLFAFAAAAAKPLPAELIMPGGRSWKGQVIGRDGDWIEFATGSSAQPIRVGANTIEELAFQIDLDMAELENLNRNMQYAQIISMLEIALKPFEAFRDIPSNLTPFNALLMELYYKTGEYAKSLEYASLVSNDERDPELQRKSVVFKGMCLIETDRLSEAEELFASYGWTRDLPDDASAEDLYITAKFLFAKKDYAAAMETVAKVIAFHSQDLEWIRPAELLCAEVYLAMGMLDSADEVIRQMTLMYKGSFETGQALKLKTKVDRARALQAEQDV
jgi:tetratricopeptide (TPR) repeat protein